MSRDNPIKNIRPPINDLVFRMYDRPLHPELFEVLARRRVTHDNYLFEATITPNGHALEWLRGKDYLLEMTATSEELFPTTGCRLKHPLRGERTGRWCPDSGIRYHMSSQVEILAPEQFLHVHEELVRDGMSKGLIVYIQPHNRLGISPLGIVIAEAMRGCLSVSSFHTFPDELAVMKTQSLIEWNPHSAIR